MYFKKIENLALEIMKSNVHILALKNSPTNPKCQMWPNLPGGPNGKFRAG
jgi:hypothetical protein